ncbi:MAG TPA: hypothetical protein VF411_04970 [Bacteroidia bacterium]
MCIAKIGNNPDKTAKCVKYRTNDLAKFANFLDRKHPEWTWYNVFLKETGKQAMSLQNLTDLPERTANIVFLHHTSKKIPT